MRQFDAHSNESRVSGKQQAASSKRRERIVWHRRWKSYDGPKSSACIMLLLDAGYCCLSYFMWKTLRQPIRHMKTRQKPCEIISKGFFRRFFFLSFRTIVSATTTTYMIHVVYLFTVLLVDNNNYEISELVLPLPPPSSSSFLFRPKVFSSLVQSLSF